MSDIIKAQVIKKIKQMFLYYGFLKTPLTNKEIVSLLLRGKTEDDIYNIGCDLYCGANNEQ